MQSKQVGGRCGMYTMSGKKRVYSIFDISLTNLKLFSWFLAWVVSSIHLI